MPFAFREHQWRRDIGDSFVTRRIQAIARRRGSELLPKRGFDDTRTMAKLIRPEIGLFGHGSHPAADLRDGQDLVSTHDLSLDASSVKSDNHLASCDPSQDDGAEYAMSRPL